MGLLVSEEAMEFDDELIFFFREIATLEIRSKVVDPPQPAALPTSKEARRLRQRTPAAFAVSSDVGSEAVVFFLGPSSFVGVSLLAARRSSHLKK